MKSWNKLKEDIANTASGGASTNGAHTGGVAGLGSPPDDEPVVRKKKKKDDVHRRIDGRTKQFKEKVKSLKTAREKRETMKFEKKWGIKLR
tara:strand:- start:3026 stop:3298 length:273 start_codon:yes stop_codon:yes gene_type:complete